MINSFQSFERFVYDSLFGEHDYRGHQDSYLEACGSERDEYYFLVRRVDQLAVSLFKVFLISAIVAAVVFEKTGSLIFSFQVFTSGCSLPVMFFCSQGIEALAIIERVRSRILV